MRLFKAKIAALGAALVLTACGGDGSSTPSFNSLVSFGDSLSDVGTYKVGTIAALGGGKWTVNSPTAMNWTEFIARDIGVAAPCPAQTGLLPNIPGFTGAPVANHAECTNFAEGSSRISQPFAPNSATLQAAPFNQVNVGFLAVPVTTQMATYLSLHGGAYTGGELVTVFAGANEIFMNLPAVAAAAGGGSSAVGAAIAAGWPQATQAAVSAGGAAAVNAATTEAVTFMAQAGAELAGLVKSQVLAKGAKYVVVVNVPDVTVSPFGLSVDAATRGLITLMVTNFNAQLASGLAGTGVLLVDAYTQSRDQAANPAQFGLSNVTSPACDPSSPNNPLQGSSIACTAASTVPGDTTNYEFADTVHPTPLGYQLIAQFVAAQMAKAGWL